MVSITLLNKKPKYIYFGCVIIIFLVFVAIMFILFKYQKYDVKEIKMQVVCDEKCYVEGNMINSYVEFINKAEKLQIDNIDYQYKIIDIGQEMIDYIDSLIYQKVKIEIVNVNLSNNLIINIKFLGNKEKLIKKILRKFI